MAKHGSQAIIMDENEDEIQFRLARAEDEDDQKDPVDFKRLLLEWRASRRRQREAHRGTTLRDRYNIYIDCLSDGEEPKTYDQWLNS
jgi:hypothetical protein